MANLPMPLSVFDCDVMNCSNESFRQRLALLPDDKQRYVVNVTHRLLEVDWLTRTLETYVVSKGSLVGHEGLLSMQVYLLLTCADALGHIYVPGNKSQVDRRFKSFFEHLPLLAKSELANDILTWRTDADTLANLGLFDGNKFSHPELSVITDHLEKMTFDKRFDAIVGFLYIRRNWYTHESDYPQLGYHPNLTVMQRQRLNIPNTVNLGYYDRLQVVDDKHGFYFTYYQTDDLVVTVRRAILRGLADVVGFV